MGPRATRGLQRSSPVLLAVLGAVGLVIGRSVRPIAESADRVAPTVSWIAPVSLGFLAAVVASLAWSTYQTVHKERLSMPSERAVRLLALAKASAIVGALVAGYYLGYALSFAGDLDVALPRQRAVRSFVAFITAAAALGAGLFLERACEVPKPPDDDPRSGHVE